MKDKDEIRELFQEKFGNYQPKVNPGLWSGIQTGLAGAKVAAAGSAMSLFSKAIIGISVAATVGVGAFLLIDKNEHKTEINPLITAFNEADSSKNNADTLLNKTLIIDLNTVESNIAEQNEDVITVNNELEINSTIIENEYDHLEILPVTIENITPINSDNLEIKGEELNNDSKSEDSETELEVRLVDLSQVEIITSKQSNQYVRFSATGVPENATVLWNFGDHNSSYSLQTDHFFNEAGNYEITLTVKADGQQIIKKDVVEISIKGEIGVLPNVFSPNGDGKNDVFFITSKYLKSFQLTVLDNNQNVVFSTEDADFVWNGIDNTGNLVKSGNYIYIIIAEDTSGNVINKYQNLTVIR